MYSRVSEKRIEKQRFGSELLNLWVEGRNKLETQRN